MKQYKKLNSRKLFLVIILGIITFSIVACGDQSSPTQDPVAIAQQTFSAIGTSTAQAIPPTATLVPVKPDIQICMANEPNTLSNYNSPNSAALQVLQALSPKFVTQVGYQYQSYGLKELPSIENGLIQIQTVEVNKGDWVINRFGNPAQLMAGVQIIPSGCTSNDCVITYQEGTIQMDQITVLFNLNENLFWNDGTPLTAKHSEFAYQIDQEDNSNGNPMLSYTSAYAALSDYQLQWIGLPGYLKSDAKTAIWQPLPQQLYSAQSIEEFLGQAQNFSWGPYQLDVWEQGQSIKIISNTYSPEYANAYPNIEFKFIGENSADSLAMLSNGDCSILLDRTFDIQANSPELQSQTDYQIIPSGAKGWLHLDFALQHRTHDDGYNLYNDQSAFFYDQLTRQAISQCINREALLAEYPYASLMPSYLSSSNPNAIENIIQYNPDAANQSLEEVGWNLAEDGVRYSQTSYILYDTKLELNLYTETTYTKAAESIKNDLAGCGVEVIINTLPTNQLYATTSDAPLFGRNFDLALFSWSSSQQDLCWLYQSQAIPGEDKSTHPYYWLGWNITAWSNPEFDTLCNQTQNSINNPQTEISQLAQQLYIQEMPSLPLIELQTYTAASNEICGFSPQQQGLDIVDFSKLGINEYCQ